ncbi:MAG: polyphosphate kinase 2 family protein [Deltaproteobacteria bacterium]|nr:polyphosphate kinase 2 family protein [Deltaproteobacteria bacterium]
MAERDYRRLPGERYDLSAIDPSDTGDYEGKKKGEKELEKRREVLLELQRKLHVDGRNSLLVVLQAMDCAGKDGTIRHVLGAFEPQGTQVASFKVPSEEERAHDFLWRIHKAVPRLGMVGIFNRSHYEEVLVVRVKELKPEAVWRTHFEHINNFERLLAESGVTIVKIFLHISPEEQAERLRDRQQRPEKQWKFSPGDLEDRVRWKSYMAAYEEALTLCNTDHAPWYVVPADKKWHRNLVVSEILIETLKNMDLQYPDPVADIDSYVIPDIE